jgi:Na+/proline symporter
VPDLVAARFGGGWPAALTAVAVAVGGIAMLAVQVKGLAVFGSALLGVPGPWMAAVTVAATTAYTAAGGMRAGLLAEALQGALMAGAAVAVAAAALAAAGGPGAALATLAAERPDLLDPWRGIGPVGAIAWFLLFALGTCAQPHYLQKFLMLRDRRALRALPAVATVALVSVLTVWVGLGLGGTALWAGGRLELSSPDDLTAAFLAGSGTALRTAAVIAVLAAVMSTAATLLNLVAAAVVRDLPRAFGRTPLPGLGAARLATLAAALAGAVLALASQRQVALLGVLGWGTFTAALFPAVAIGLNWTGATRRGAIAALLAGPATQIAFEWLRAAGEAGPSWEPGLTGTAVGVIVLVAVSRAGTPRERRPA